MSDSSNNSDKKDKLPSGKQVMTIAEKEKKLRKIELIDSIIEELQKDKKNIDNKPDDKDNENTINSTKKTNDKQKANTDSIKANNLTNDTDKEKTNTNNKENNTYKQTIGSTTPTNDKQIKDIDNIKTNNITSNTNHTDNKDIKKVTNDKTNITDNKNTKDKTNIADEKNKNDVMNTSVSAFINTLSKERKIKSKSARRKIFSNKNTTNLKIYLIASLTVIAILMAIVFINFDKFKNHKVKALNEDENTEQSDSKDSKNNKDKEDTNANEGETSTTLYAVGDNICYENIYATGKKGDTLSYDHLFKNLKSDIQSADTAVINQETVFYPTYSAYPTFGSPKEIAPSLVNAGFDVVLHATNHAADKGIEGLNYTFKTWKDYPDIKVLGINENESDTEKITVVEKNGIKIAMLNYTYGLNGLSISKPYMINIFNGNEERVTSDVSNAKKQADCVVVFMHWGSENVLRENDEQKKWASILANSGADLVIGAHPHVIQPVKWITGDNGHKTLVYYSLGNLVSSQDSLNNYVGASCNVTFTKKGDKTKITKAEVTPTFMHIQKPYDENTTVYKLADYNTSLASKHMYSFVIFSSVDKAKKLATEILGSDSTTSIPIEE